MTSTEVFRVFPFGSPAYAWRDAAGAVDVVAFDCTRCPVAELFAKHGASELCVKTWCNLDFPLAEKWSGQLWRTGTIAAGSDRCDFRWTVAGAREPEGSSGRSLHDLVEKGGERKPGSK